MAGYNNYAQGYYPYPNWGVSTQAQTAIPQQPNAGLVFTLVADEAEVKSYPVGAGNSVLLMSLQTGKFWIKSTGANGVPEPIRSFSFVEDTPQPAPKEPDYVTKDEFAELKKMIEDLLK